MTYPLPTVVAQVIGTNVEDDDGLQMRRAVSGRPRFHTYYSQTWRTFTVVHEVDNQTDYDLLMDHFEDNQFLEFSFTLAANGEAYNVRYNGAPKRQLLEGNFRWRITNTLVESP